MKYEEDIRMSVKASIVSNIVKKEIRRIREDPATRIPELIDWGHGLDKSGNNEEMFRSLERIAKDTSNNWNVMIRNILNNIQPSFMEKFVANFAVNAFFASASKRERIMKREGCNIPSVILMDPTTSCNLHCTGCWAADYRKSSNMDYATLDRIITEGKKLGIYFYLYSGGEPLVRSEDILHLARRHHDCLFLSFTNGILVDEHFVKESYKLGNIMLAISIEGYEEETDMRRGTGTYKKVLAAMDMLKSHGVPFGFSTCYHHYNAKVVGSDEWLDFMVQQGCYFGWYFTYMPLGQDARLDLLATPDDREYMYHQVRKSRESRPIFLIDFWNDGEFVKGCIAGGRTYLHINADGDVEPCAFIHYSSANIHDMSLLEALKQPLFKEYARNQPFNENMLRPCPLLDNPGKLQSMVEQSGAHSTQLPVEENVADLTAKCRDVAGAWEERAALLWNKEL